MKEREGLETEAKVRYIRASRDVTKILGMQGLAK